MATPAPRSGVGQSIARAALGGNPGGLGGRRPGLAPVRADLGGGDPVSDTPDAAGFTQRYVSLSRSTSQPFGNELAIAWTAETTHGSPIDFRGGNAVPTSLPNVSVTQPYSVGVFVLVSSVPTDLCVELRGNFGAVAGQFDKVGASSWRAAFSAVVVPDVTALSTLSVVGKGTGADVTCTLAGLTIYPLR
jgi:hypothetical protein